MKSRRKRKGFKEKKRLWEVNEIWVGVKAKKIYPVKSKQITERFVFPFGENKSNSIYESKD